MAKAKIRKRKETCEFCKFFLNQEVEKQLSECHYNPPVFDLSRVGMDFFPRVQKNNFCGRYEDNPKRVVVGVPQTRVHLLAKELGVKSESIVKKCQTEGLGVKNHMSTISAGLAAAIREWFSEGEHATTVETSKRVDLKKVRVKRPKKKAKPEEGVVELLNRS